MSNRSVLPKSRKLEGLSLKPKSCQVCTCFVLEVRKLPMFVELLLRPYNALQGEDSRLARS